jgi:hypothetical protein
MAMGRPTDYSEDLADKFCALISEGNSMAKVCRSNDDMPSTQTIFRWFRIYPDFCDKYARAKEESGDADQDKIDDIAEKVLDGKLEPQQARVAADLIKWSASKKKPKKYGDRVEQVHSGHLRVTDMSDEELDRRLVQLQNGGED